MADTQSNEDAALCYVLGELNATERREFESLMTTSIELRALVDELETGMIATASAAPRRRPPAEVWLQIEKNVAKKSSLKLGLPIFKFGWLHNGWAVAVICLAGGLFHAFVAHQHYTDAMTTLKNQQLAMATVNLPEPPSKPFVVKSSAPAVTNVAFELLQARTREIIELRGKIARLETATTQLSRSITQQKALLGESNRIKFYHLAPVSTTGASASTAPLSAGLQRAVFMALARELGWLATDTQSAAQMGGKALSTPVSIGGVDFIDLRPDPQGAVSQPQAQLQNGSSQPTADNNTANTQVQPQTQAQTESPATTQGTTASDPTIPAFVSGDNLVVALDSTAVPSGSLVSLSVLDANQNETGGNFILGDNPAVVTVPFNSPIYTVAGLSGLAIVTMSFQTPNGQTGTIQFYAPPTTNP